VENHWTGLRFDFWFLHWFAPSGSPRWGAGLLVVLVAGLVWGAAGIVKGTRAAAGPALGAPVRRAG
jgi:hypothetical protein